MVKGPIAACGSAGNHAMLRRILPLLVILTPLPATAAEFEFKDGDRVVLIGSTLIEREQRYGYWEAALTAANPDKNITFRNLGWSGDTVWGEARAGFGTPADGYKALIDHVKAEKPTVIIVGYGTNESFAGEAGLPKFKEQLKKLLDDLAVTKARFVLIKPMKMIKKLPPLPDAAKANESIELYRDAIKVEGERRQAVTVYPLIPSDEVLTAVEKIAPVTDNGLHLTRFGYELTCGPFASRLGGLNRISRITINATTKTCTVDGGKVVREGGSLQFRVTANILGIPDSLPNGEKGGPVLIVNGIPDDQCQLKIDGKEVMFSRLEHTYGVYRLIASGPELEQAEKLRQTIIAKNELYFHRWRPANVTYLFGFRKYEQGNNAVEIPQFDPLVEAKEKEIAKLRKPVEHVYELVPVKK
jgi:hypothetical protein